MLLQRPGREQFGAKLVVSHLELRTRTGEEAAGHYDHIRAEKKERAD